MKVYIVVVFFSVVFEEVPGRDLRMKAGGQGRSQKSWWSGWLKGLKFGYKPSPISGGLTMVYKTEIGDGVLTMII